MSTKLIILSAIALTFTPPVDREDGTPLDPSEIKEYISYIDGVEHPTRIPGSASSAEYPTLDYACIKLRTVDTDGRVSKDSNELCKGTPPIGGEDIPVDNWSVVYASSYENDNWLMPPQCAFNREAQCTTQGDIWHSRYTPTEALPPHELVVDMGQTYIITGFKQQPRAGGGNATAKDYSFHLSTDGNSWTQVAGGTFPPGDTLHTVNFENSWATTNSNVVLANGQFQARYWKFVCLTEQDGGNQCSTDEIYLTGTLSSTPPPNAPIGLVLE